MDRHLRGIRAGDEIRRSEQVKEALVVQPFPPLDDLVVHHGDVGRRTAEGRDAKPEKASGDFRQSSWWETGGHGAGLPCSSRPCFAPDFTAKFLKLGKHDFENITALVGQVVASPGMYAPLGSAHAAQPAVAFHSLKQGIHRSWTDLVSMAAQLLEHHLTQDRKSVG